jgi:hypothetical protein
METVRATQFFDRGEKQKPSLEYFEIDRMERARSERGPAARSNIKRANALWNAKHPKMPGLFLRRQAQRDTALL